MLANFKNKKKRSPGQQFLIYFGAFLVMALVIGLIVNDVRIFKKRKEFNAQIESLQKQVKDIQRQNDKLKEGISESDNNQYIEKVAREQLDLQKPGEQTVSFIAPKTEAQASVNAQQNGVQGWLASVWSLIVGK